jgi:MFS family permease
MILNRVKPAWYMSGFMMAWAIVSTLTCLVHNYHGMLVCCLLLGFVEAPFYPGALFMISLFYNRKEATTRMAILYTGNMLASHFQGSYLQLCLLPWIRSMDLRAGNGCS